MQRFEINVSGVLCRQSDASFWSGIWQSLFGVVGIPEECNLSVFVDGATINEKTYCN